MTRDRVGREAQAVAAAFTFMTRLPLGRFASHDASELAASATYFPLVGAIVGSLGAVSYAMFSQVWTPSIALLLAVAVTAYVTGAFHEDALADALDGFGGGRTPERVLEIMKDSRVGAFALVGVALTLAIKVAALFSVATDQGVRGVAGALIAGHTLARWSSVPLMWRYEYVRSQREGERASAGGPFATGSTASQTVVASLIAALIAVGAIGVRGASTASIVTAVVTALAGRWFYRRIGGITGDALGAASQVVEVCVYLAIAARA